MALALAAIIGPGCVNVPRGDACSLLRTPQRADGNCLRLSAVEQYLALVREETLELYESPPGESEPGYVEFRYTLDSDGSVVNRCVARTSHRDIAVSLLKAFDSAAPFPPMPRFARCLSQAQVVRHVYTPARRFAPE